MAKLITKSVFLADLKTRLQQNREAVSTVFCPLDPQQLAWQPHPKEWNILQCFDHLNLTHRYYQGRIEQALKNPVAANHEPDRYRPSFWGRIYMHFALNPNYSFPAAAEIAPTTKPQPEVLDIYLTKLDALSQVLNEVDEVDLSKTPTPIEKGVKFNLGDCFKVLVYHDGLHIRQARGVLTALAQAGDQ